MAKYYIEIRSFGSGVLIDNDGSGKLVASSGASNAANDDYGSLQDGGWNVGSSDGSRIEVLSSAPVVGLWISDDEGNFQDGQGDPGAAQCLLYPVTINGVTYPAGARVELEYGLDVQGEAADGSDFYVVRLGGNGLPEDQGDTGTNVGVLATTTDPLVLDKVCTVAQSNDGPSISFLNALCFVDGTRIETPDGPRLVEDLRPGDLVTTRDHGAQVLRWVGAKPVTLTEMVINAALRPVRFETGSIGNARPLLVSPQHRMLIADWRAQLWYGEDQVLVAAKALLDGQAIRQVMPPNGLTYFHLLFDGHEILLAEGAWSESFHPGGVAQDVLSADQRAELELLFPGLVAGLVGRSACYPVVPAGLAPALVEQG